MSNLSTPFDILCLVVLKIPTSDHGIAGSNPAGGENLPEPKRRFNAQSLSCIMSLFALISKTIDE